MLIGLEVSRTYSFQYFELTIDITNIGTIFATNIRMKFCNVVNLIDQEQFSETTPAWGVQVYYIPHLV